MVVEILNEEAWKHSLVNRKYFSAFRIPKKITENRSIKDGTKRKFEIETSSGKKFEGVFTISSGEEIQFPKAFTGFLEKQEYFIARVVDMKIYENVDFLEIV